MEKQHTDVGCAWTVLQSGKCFNLEIRNDILPSFSEFMHATQDVCRPHRTHSHALQGYQHNREERRRKAGKIWKCSGDYFFVIPHPGITQRTICTLRCRRTDGNHRTRDQQPFIVVIYVVSHNKWRIIGRRLFLINFMNLNQRVANAWMLWLL